MIMKERNLFKISLIGSIVGLVILWLISTQMGLSESPIDQIDDIPEGEEVLIRGVLTKIGGNEKVAFLDVAQEKIESVTVVLFKDSDVELSVGDYVEVEGTVEDYLGKKEIIGNQIEVK